MAATAPITLFITKNLSNGGLNAQNNKYKLTHSRTWNKPKSAQAHGNDFKHRNWRYVRGSKRPGGTAGGKNKRFFDRTSTQHQRRIYRPN